MSERIQNVQPKEWNGVNFRSTLEAKTAETLDALGIPYQYECRKIVLQEGFRCPYQKDKVRAITYTPDFEIGSSIILECKGFETPEWKNKKKMLFKYLIENEPSTCFYQIHDCGRQLLLALDNHWPYLGYHILVSPKPKKSRKALVPEASPSGHEFDSIQEAMQSLHLQGKPLGSILQSLTGKREYAYNYNWQLVKN